LKPLEDKICRWRGIKLLCGTGWLLALLLSIWAAPRIYHRLIVNFSLHQGKNWNQILTDKKRELSSYWQDPRPLVILAGDSQIEMGNWYDLFSGEWAVRNCGLSQAKISDVTEIVSAIGDQHPKTVILMCGINNLGAHESPEACLLEYEDLLAGVRSHLQPETVIALSVMPVRESAVDRASHELNMRINQFNVSLAAFCGQHQVVFLNVNPAVAAPNGGLADRLTSDGLHLNPDGYRRMAQVIAPRLAQSTNTP
jgi:lysophospholipase L1-like esterase